MENPQPGPVIDMAAVAAFLDKVRASVDQTPPIDQALIDRALREAVGIDQVEIADLQEHIRYVFEWPQRVPPLSQLTAPGSEASTDVVVWTRDVLQQVVAIGGPILLLQVVVIVWLLAAQVNADARQQVSELAGLIALALALAPAFKKVAERLDDKDDEK